MRAIPTGWTVARLDQLVEILDGRRIPVSAPERAKRPGEVPYYGASGQVGTIDEALFDEPLLLLGEDGVQFFDPFKSKAYHIRGRSWVNNHAHVLRVKAGTELTLLEYYLNQFDYRGFANGTTRLKLTQAAMRRIPVVLPELEEQRRIVAILEEHLADIDSAVRGVEACQGRLDALRSKTLQWALHRATEDDDWSPLTIGELADVGTGTTPLRSKKDYYDGGTIPWITSGDLSGGLVIEPKQYVTALALHETSLRVYPPRTLLVAMYGEGKTRGSVAELGIAAAINQACAAIQLRNPEMLGWVRLVLAANYSAMRALASGGVQPNLNLSLVRGIPVPVPNEPTRRRLLGIQLALDDAAQRLRLELQEAASRARSLRRALLAAAFSGRLTGGGSDIDVMQEIAEEESA